MTSSFSTTTSPLLSLQVPLLVLLQLVCLLGGETAYTERHVNSDTGVDNSTCWEGSIPCATLAYALEDLHNDTTVLLDNEVVSHPNITTVQGGPVSNITVSGYHGNTVIDCSDEGGFAFINVDGLTISNVNFHNCGAIRNSTSYNGSGEPITYTVSLYLYNCTDVTLVSTTISNSPGAGVAMLAVTGHVEIKNSTFIGNGHLISRNESQDHLRSELAGGALYIELPSCAPGIDLLECNEGNDFCPSSLPSYSDATYIIEKCSFRDNTAQTPDYKNYSFIDYPNTNYFTAIGRGGGLSVFIKGRSENIRVVVRDSSFDNNWALYGGGLFMELWHLPINVSLEVVDSNFMQNALPYNSTKNMGTGGGGLRYAQPYCHGEGTTLLIKGCRFEDNKAYWGGGASLSLQSENGSTGSDVIIENCTFQRNTARLGAAIDFNNYKGKPAVIVHDLTVINNSDRYVDTEDGSGHIKGEGVIYTFAVTVYVCSSVKFSHNMGGAISSLYGTIHFFNDSTSLFHDNQAYRGAALALYGNAAIVLHNGSQLNFTENKADTVGGAIYHAALGNRALLDSGACPIKMARGLNWSNTDLWFINNVATQGGRGMSIYTYSIYPCVERSLDELYETFRWSTFNYVCDNQMKPNCGDLQVSGDGSFTKPNRNVSLPLTAFPGEEAPLPFTVEDELHNEVQVHFEGVVHDNNSTYAVDMLNNSKILITGRPQKGAELELHSTESQTLDVRMRLNIVQCPPGFELSSNAEGHGVCECGRSAPGLMCDKNHSQTRLDYNYWVGYINNTSDGFLSGHCPPGFCYYRLLTLNGSDHYNLSSLDEVVCGPQHRTGVLCGKCKEGYGVSVYQPFPCVRCNDSTSRLTVNGRYLDVLFIWFFTEFIPFNIVFLLFILFNVNILSGWGGALYTFVFFCQVVTTTPVFPTNNLSIFRDSPSPFIIFLSINKFISDFWSLNFFSYFVPPKYSCFSESTTVQDAIIGAYFTLLLWPLLLYILLTAIHRCYHRGYCCRPAHRCLFRMGRTLAKCQQSEGGVNSVAGLCSFFILAYTKLVILTWEIFVKTEVQYSNRGPRNVFWYNGTVPWFDPTHHLPYALPILLCSFVTVFIPTLLLISFPLVPKLLVKLNLHERRPFRWIISFLSTSFLLFLYDIFQGCFKPNTRYFAALYLIYRHVFVMAWALTNNQETGVFQLSFCILFTLFHSFAQPFRSDKVNKMAALIFAVLALIIMGGDMLLYLDQCQNGNTSSMTTTVEVITLLLLFVPHVVAAFFFILYCARLVRAKYYKGRGQGAHPREGPEIVEMEVSGRYDDDWKAVKHIFDRGADEWDDQQEEEGNDQNVIGGEGEREVLVESSPQDVHGPRTRTRSSHKHSSGYGTL